MKRTSPTRILVGVDFSPASLLAAAWARDLADTAGADLVLCHVVTPVASLFLPAGAPVLEGLLSDEDWERLPSLRVAEGRQRLRNEARKLGVTEAEVDVHLGLPVEGLVTRAKKLRADLIVVGVEGLSGDGGGRMGSVAERVVRHASVPVTVVRAAR